MSRLPRQNVPGRVYHLIARFVDRDWYIETEREREKYMLLLARALGESDWRCLAYAVMSNHIHLCAVCGAQPLDAWVRRVHAPFADWMNRRRDRIGSVFVRGPKDLDVSPARLGAVLAYIHKNPVRAGVVQTARASTWTSHRAYVGLEPVPPWLHVEEGLSRAGFHDASAFDDFVYSSDDSTYAAEVEEELESPVVRPRRIPDVGPGQVVAATARELALPERRLCSSRRGPAEVFGRRVVAHCAAAVGLSGVQIASALNLSQQAISAMQRRAMPDDVARVSAIVLARLGLSGH